MVVGPDVVDRGSRSAAPVVPGRLPLLGHTMSLLSTPFRFLSTLRSHGEVVQIYLGTLPMYVVTSPELAWQVLATDADKFDKGMIFDKGTPAVRQRSAQLGRRFQSAAAPPDAAGVSPQPDRRLRPQYGQGGFGAGRVMATR